MCDEQSLSFLRISVRLGVPYLLWVDVSTPVHGLLLAWAGTDKVVKSLVMSPRWRLSGRLRQSRRHRFSARMVESLS